MELDKLLWRGGNHIALKQLVEDFAKYIYLPRLKDPQVLLKAISDGVALLTWVQDSFALADDFDEESKRYRGLRGNKTELLDDPNANILIVKPQVASHQMEKERSGDRPTSVQGNKDSDSGENPDSSETTITQPKRFHGSVEVDATRAGRDVGQISEEVISHLWISWSRSKGYTEIEAKIPDGTPDNVVRTVTENSKALKFKSHGFERE